MIHPAAPTSSNNTQPPTPDSLQISPGASTAAAAFGTEAPSTAAADTEIEDSPARQSSSSSCNGGEGASLSSSGSIDSVGMNNRGLLEGKTQLAVIFLVDSSGSVGDGE
jgi:hypothetical protein